MKWNILRFLRFCIDAYFSCERLIEKSWQCMGSDKALTNLFNKLPTLLSIYLTTFEDIHGDSKSKVSTETLIEFLQ